MQKHGSAATEVTGILDWPTRSALDRDRLLLDWNRTETDFPCHASIDQLFEEQVSQRPEAIALEHNGDFFEIGGDSLLAVRIFAEVERSLGRHLP